RDPCVQLRQGVDQVANVLVRLVQDLARLAVEIPRARPVVRLALAFDDLLDDAFIAPEERLRLAYGDCMLPSRRARRSLCARAARAHARVVARQLDSLAG